MKQIIPAVVLLFFLTACCEPVEPDLPACASAPAEVPEEGSPAPPLREAPEQPATAEPSPEEEVPVEKVPSEDHVLLTLEAPLADGRTLRLEAVGKRLDEYSAGVREVRVYDGDALMIGRAHV